MYRALHFPKNVRNFLCEYCRFALKLAAIRIFFQLSEQKKKKKNHVCKPDLVLALCFATSGLDDIPVRPDKVRRTSVRAALEV